MRWFQGAVLLFFVLLLCACATPKGEWFAPFAGCYETELCGSVNGVEFSVGLSMQSPSPDGTRAATLTFYAPQELAGVTLSRDAAGTVTLASGTWKLDNASLGTLVALLDVFPTDGSAVRDVEVTDSGRTRVVGDGFVVEFLSDGTPAAIQTPTLSATVVSFRAG